MKELKIEMRVSPHIYKLVKLICKAIKERQLLYFYYESDSGNYWRKIRPYMIILNENKKLKVVGLPIEELKIAFPKNRKKGHYLLDKLDMNRFEILDDIFFDNLWVPREIVVHTINPVVCRFIYDDENTKEVKNSWIKYQSN